MDDKLRIPLPEQTEIIFRDKNKYSRREKYKKDWKDFISEDDISDENNF